MGLFSKLFKKDPQEELAKLEALVSRGDHGEKTLKLALKLENSDVQQIGERARVLGADIKAAHAAELLGNAKRSEAAGNMVDALDWMEAALPYVAEQQAQSLQSRIREIEESLDQDAGRPLIGGGPVAAGEVEGDGEDIDFDAHFEMLMGMLTEEVAARYEALPRAFHEAHVSLNNGDVARARDILDELLERAPGDAILQLERARCALFLNEEAQARTLLERAWPTLGDDFLDEAHTLSVPSLWAEAMLRLNEPGPVIERLAPLADPKDNRPLICQSYALALEAGNELALAKKYLVAAGTRFDRLPNFPFLLARVMDRSGDWQGAIKVLESKVGPSCGGNCGTAKHPASMRMLLGLYLANDQSLKKIGDLLLHLESALSGFLSREDLLAAAEYHRRSGDDKAAQAAEEAAAELEEVSGTGLESDVTKAVGSGGGFTI